MKALTSIGSKRSKSSLQSWGSKIKGLPELDTHMLEFSEMKSLEVGVKVIKSLLTFKLSIL